MFKTLMNSKVLYGLIGSVVTVVFIRNIQLRTLNKNLITAVNHHMEVGGLAADAVEWMSEEFDKGTDFDEINEGFKERAAFLRTVHNLTS